jgi:hypothetical protein
MLTARTALDEMLGILRSDAPLAFFRLMEELGSLNVDVQVDSERFSVSGKGTHVVVAEVQENAQVYLRTDRHTILALIDGRRSMLEAVLARELSLSADISLLGQVGRAGIAFGDGAIRARRARGVLDAFRRSGAVQTLDSSQS